MLRSAPWRHVFRDVWAHREMPDTRELRLACVRLVLNDDAVAGGLTAAWLLGLDIRRLDDLDVHASFPKGRRQRERPGLVVCQETLDHTDICEIDGLSLTTPLRTTFDCLRFLRRPEGLVVADAMTHAALTSVEQVAAYFASKRGLRNLRIGGALVDQIEPLAESPMETRMRVRMTSSGLPRPEAQIEVFEPDGRFVARLDSGYREQRTAAEYDGAQHWEQRRHDDRRRDAVRALGWDVLVFSAEDIVSRDDRLEQQVWRSLHRHYRA